MDQQKVSQYIRARKTDTLPINVQIKKGSDYESVVKSRVQKNKELLASLGFEQTICTQLMQSCNKREKRDPKRSMSKEKQVSIPCRKSRRLAGEEAPNIFNTLFAAEKSAVKSSTITNQDNESNDLHDITASSTILYPTYMEAPYTLKSIKTTVYKLGNHVGIEDSCSLQFMSLDGCKFKHPYPVGYRASKKEFGKAWLMGIERNDNGGPVFFIQLLEEHEEEMLLTGNDIPMRDNAYKGYAPTWPWTQACLKSRSPGRRISGPLYFGFSDALNIYHVMSMNGAEKIVSLYDKTYKKTSKKKPVYKNEEVCHLEE
eukprot:jgi/Galph1/3110/GphlegSOOS_G1765.1